jgi:hypothetical protein
MAVVGVGALTFVCCAGLPLVGGLVGGLTVAGVLGVGGGVLIVCAVAGVGLLAWRTRRRQGCSPPLAGSPARERTDED